MAAKVLVENNSDGTTLITINRPERRNAIDADTAVLLQKAFREFAKSETQRAAVITGAGNDAFSGGADTANFPELWRCIPTVGFQTNKPIVSAVGGWCVGGARPRGSDSRRHRGRPMPTRSCRLGRAGSRGGGRCPAREARRQPGMRRPSRDTPRRRLIG